MYENNRHNFNVYQMEKLKWTLTFQETGLVFTTHVLENTSQFSNPTY